MAEELAGERFVEDKGVVSGDTQGVPPPPVFFAKSAEAHERKEVAILLCAKECARM